MDTTRSTGTAFSQQLVAELVHDDGMAIPLDAELSFDAADPFAVSAVFGTDLQSVRWTFARDLLSDGLVEPTGDGDVHVWPCLDGEGLAVVVVELCSESGEALLQLPIGDVAEFVERMHASVPRGEESDHLDIDALISAIQTAEPA